MGWTIPRHNRGRVDAAGDSLLAESQTQQEHDTALEVIDNWRMSHHYPLQIIKINLLKWANSVDPKSLVYQRIKRLTSIETKLQRHPRMKLSQMQDLGGCRAVVATASHVSRLAALYEKRNALQDKRRADKLEVGDSQLLKMYDYISKPKPDGYRSLHFVYKYHAGSGRSGEVYNGLRIEIQVRSRLQHAWASAVETVDVFTSQSLKSNSGSAQWKRFFALIGNEFALREKGAPVPETPSNRAELKEEIAHLARCLNVEAVLAGWNVAAQSINTHTETRIFLLILDLERRKLRIRGYRSQDRQRAQDDLAQEEKSTAVNAVLVDVASIRSLRRAFPSYYLDAGSFITALKRAIE